MVVDVPPQSSLVCIVFSAIFAMKTLFVSTRRIFRNFTVFLLHVHVEVDSQVKRFRAFRAAMLLDQVITVTIVEMSNQRWRLREQITTISTRVASDFRFPAAFQFFFTHETQRVLLTHHNNIEERQLLPESPSNVFDMNQQLID
jgi:hypothetical protein